MTESYRAEEEANKARLVKIRNESDSENAVLKAIELMGNRAWGRPPQAVLHAEAGGDEMSALRVFLKSIDGQSRQLPDFNDPDADGAKENK